LTKTDTKCPVHSLEVCWFQPTTQASESFFNLYFLLTLYRKCKNFQIIISQTTEPVGNGENVFSVQEVKRKSAPTRAAHRFGTVYTLQSRLLARIAACIVHCTGRVKKRFALLRGGLYAHDNPWTMDASSLWARQTQPIARSRGVTPPRCGWSLPLLWKLIANRRIRGGHRLCLKVCRSSSGSSEESSSSPMFSSRRGLPNVTQFHKRCIATDVARSVVCYRTWRSSRGSSCSRGRSVLSRAVCCLSRRSSSSGSPDPEDRSSAA